MRLSWVALKSGAWQGEDVEARMSLGKASFGSPQRETNSCQRNKDTAFRNFANDFQSLRDGVSGDPQGGKFAVAST